MNQYVPNLGQLCGDDARRDAVHVPVAPVEAGQDLLPAQRVSIAPDGRAVYGDDPVGIVDPFLTEPVKRGQRFWVFVFPGTITGLRHLWTHKAFAPVKPPVREDHP